MSGPSCVLAPTRGFSGQELLFGVEEAGAGKWRLFEQVPGKFIHASASPHGSVKPFIGDTFIFLKEGNFHQEK